MKTNAVTKTYEGKTVLDMPAMEFEPGRICAVIGANGSGKTTYAKILAGVIRSDGKVKPVAGAERIGYMPQKSYPFRMSTLSNVNLIVKDKDRALELMRTLSIDHLAKQRAGSLSGGETARMALARLLMGNFDVLVLDEPTASMDIESTALTEELIKKVCRERQCVVILVTHSLKQVQRVADDLIFLHKGKPIERGEAKQILASPSRPETKQFLEFFGD